MHTAYSMARLCASEGKGAWVGLCKPFGNISSRTCGTAACCGQPVYGIIALSHTKGGTLQSALSRTLRPTQMLLKLADDAGDLDEVLKIQKSAAVVWKALEKIVSRFHMTNIYCMAWVERNEVAGRIIKTLPASTCEYSWTWMEKMSDALSIIAKIAWREKKSKGF